MSLPVTCTIHSHMDVLRKPDILTLDPALSPTQSTFFVVLSSLVEPSDGSSVDFTLIVCSTRHVCAHVGRAEARRAGINLTPCLEGLCDVMACDSDLRLASLHDTASQGTSQHARPRLHIRRNSIGLEQDGELSRLAYCPRSLLLTLTCRQLLINNTTT